MKVDKTWHLHLKYEFLMKNKFVNLRTRYFEVPFEKAKTEDEAENYFYNYLLKNPDYHPINDIPDTLNFDNVVKAAKNNAGLFSPLLSSSASTISAIIALVSVKGAP